MSFVQTKDVLKAFEKCGKSTLKGYLSLKSQVEDPDARGCLERAIAQEQRLVFALSSYARTASPVTLNVWFQSPGLRQLSQVARRIEEAVIRSKEDALALVMQCHEIWASVCHNLCSSPLNLSVREVFCNLHDTRTQLRRDLMWQMNRES